MKKAIIKMTIFLAAFIYTVNVYAKDGWVEENNKTYYYENDETVKGFKEIESKIYYFDNTLGNLEYGWQNDGKNTWYQDESGEVLTGLQEINGDKYYFDENGFMFKGFKEIDDKLYFFSRANGKLKQGWQNAQEGNWYQNESGEVVRGIYEIDKDKYYFDEQTGIQYKGFKKINDKLYFFSRVNGKLKHGWQNDQDGKWFQNELGEVLTGVQNIGGDIYLFNENGFMYKGFKEIGGKLYFYSRANGKLKHGWQNAQEGNWYQNETGEVVRGIQTIGNDKYYFNINGILENGFKEIDGKLYFFSRANGKLKRGWQNAKEGTWYQNASGEVVKGLQTIDNDKYYFNANGILENGFKEIDGKLYFFSRANGKLKYGWQNAQEGTWYQRDDGTVVTGNGLITINNKEYFLKDNFVQKGMISIDNKLYYFDETTYEKRYGTVSTRFRDYILDNETGELKRVQYIPYYYSQKDSAWVNKKYGFSTIGKTGCSPTSMSMAFTSILNRLVLPTEVANFLYSETDQYNKRLAGTSGMGIIYAANRFGVKYNAINTKEELIDELKSGKIVYAAMGNGKFASLKWNHAIVIHSYNESNNSTIASDPLNTLNNGMVNVNTIWNEKSTDPDDLTGGAALYSLYLD